MSYIDVLEELEATSSSNKKLEILQAHSDNLVLKEFLRLAVDPRHVFGVKKADYSCSESQGIDDEIAWELGSGLMYRLLEGLSGSEAQDAVVQVFSQLSPLQAKWFKKCIQKDLASIKLSHKSINKVWSELILDYEVMLAEPEDKIGKAKFPGYLDLKMNGLRCEFHIGEDGQVYTPNFDGEKWPLGRSGLPLYTFAFLIPYIEQLGLSNIVLDGELHCNHDLSNIQTILGFKHRSKDEFAGKNGKLKEKAWLRYLEDEQRADQLIREVKFSVFATLHRSEWETRTCEAHEHEMKRRLEVLREVVGIKNAESRIEITPYQFVEDYDAAIAAANEYIAMGLEGGVYKWADGLYEWKRSINWIKIKEEDETDVVIVGVLPADPVYDSNGKEKPTMLGKFEVTDGTHTFEVGTGKGWSHEFKIQAWENREEYIGKVMQVTAQRFTEDSAICPRFGCWRPDKTSRDIIG